MRLLISFWFTYTGLYDAKIDSVNILSNWVTFGESRLPPLNLWTITQVGRLELRDTNPPLHESLFHGKSASRAPCWKIQRQVGSGPRQPSPKSSKSNFEAATWVIHGNSDANVFFLKDVYSFKRYVGLSSTDVQSHWHNIASAVW